MKVLLVVFILLNFWRLSAQNDTLIEENIRNIGDILFTNLNQSIYGPSLLNRSFTSQNVIHEQIKGNYNQIHNVTDFLEIYHDVALSYVDSTKMLNNADFAAKIESIFAANEISSEEDILIQPFGLVYHYTSCIDSNKINSQHFSIQSFSLMPNGDEHSLYREVLIKSASILEFYPESGYERGYLKYTPSLVSCSPEIQNLQLRINVGNGFQPFNESNQLILYNRNLDSLLGFVELSFVRFGVEIVDTLKFYLTTVGEKDEANIAKSTETWDHYWYYINQSGIVFNCGIKRGCGTSGSKIRKPIIIVAPYRPTIQPFSLNKYYKQFNFKSLISSLADMGYDVIFIKQLPGNVSLEDAGKTLADFIDEVNIKKAEDYPNESWENIVIGYSMGGQIARYALKLKEYRHMAGMGEHHHTRLYLPYDSPHLGANIPMFTQFVYQDLKNSNISAHLAYNSLVDEASKDMSVSHVIATPPSINNFGSLKILTYTPAQTSERISFVNELTNSLNHQFTPLNDLRVSYPTFTRNVAVSTERNDQNYTHEFGLNPGMELFSQNAAVIALGGLYSKHRRVYSSKYALNQTLFRNKVQLLTFLYPITIKNRDYRLNYGYEWDMAQGGYKDEFYDKVPTGVVPILRSNANGWGQKQYDNHMNFLPLVSALGINPTKWNNNNLFFDTREEGLMFQKFGYDPIDDNSELFGYPHLAHPFNHFEITPFEAVYADPQTYEHIKMLKSVEADELNEDYLVYIRDFILNEVEADVVALQNTIIGKNHIQGLSTFKYKAWYKAYAHLVIGNTVTPKTNPGDFIIENTGDITVYAGESVTLKPGFHAQAGSNFHAFILNDGCSRPREEGGKSMGSSKETEISTDSLSDVKTYIEEKTESADDIRVFPNPTTGKCLIKIPLVYSEGNYTIVNMNGVVIQKGVFENKTEQILDLPKGIYFFQWSWNEGKIVKKIIVL